MKIMIEATDQITNIEGVPVRHWRGTTEAGVECDVFVHRIAAHKDADTSAFDRELQAQLPPARTIPLSMIL